jgi:predicted RecB family nuclease
MSARLSRDVLEGYLNCKYKAHLKLAGERGSQSDYEALLAEQRDEVRLRAIERIVTGHKEDEVARNIPLTVAALKPGPLFVVDATLEDDLVSLHFDGLKRVAGPSKLGDFHYIPMLFHEGRSIRKEQRLLLEVYALLLSRIQGRMPDSGIVWHGHECRPTRVRLGTHQREAERVLRDLEHPRSGEPPRLVLNDHCHVCEFRQRCHAQAVKDDDLSLLRGMSEQEIGRQNRKGIFTVRQLSYTFRVRRRNKRVKSQVVPHSFALQALAIRENKTHVHGTFGIPASPTSVYLDMEGVPGQDLYYLIGLVVVENGVESRHSYWAGDGSEQPAMFAGLLEKLAQYAEYRLFHFGNYETRALKRIKDRLPEPLQQQVETALGKAVNVLSIIYPHVYFPTYSCSLKDIGRFIGYSWSQPDASGVQSVVWRTAWERSRDESLKARLIRYNMEDCLALKAVVEFLARLAPGRQAGDIGSPTSSEVVHTRDLQSRSGRRHRFGKQDSTLPGFDYVNLCAYFDHQRDKVFVRTNPRLKAIGRGKRRARCPSFPINKTVELLCKRCISCNSRKLFQIGQVARQIIDLRYFRDGVKRWITKYVSLQYSCTKCGAVFVHPDYPQATTKYGRGLSSWCIYQNIVGGQNMHRVRKVLAEVFKLSLRPSLLYRFKTAAADYYRPTYARILEEILKGPILHIAETEVNLRGLKGYVWVLTNMERVYFFYRESREGTFLKDMLRGFAGVLVSDFYTAYDSLDCPQQKCLIHLLRELNEDMLKNPFDEEFRTLAQGFSSLLRSVVETVDRYGLKRRHLHKHQAEVEAFLDRVCSAEPQSEVARGYRKRFEKYRGKLFTFLDYDGVPWNNNNAEHAIKCFAKYRQFADGRFTEASLNDNLVILSVYQSCEYQGVNFLDFLRGKGQDEAGDFGSGRRRPLLIRGQPTSSAEPDSNAGPPTGDDLAARTGPNDD